MVIPRSRSRSIRSKYWSRICRSATAWVSSRKRSASVDFPWSIWATTQKLRIRDWSTVRLGYAVALVESAAVANIKSQIKRNRQNDRRQERNKAIRTALKTGSKKLRIAVESGEVDAARAELKTTSRQIDKAVSRGALNKRAAARRKSRLARAVGPGAEGSA